MSVRTVLVSLLAIALLAWFLRDADLQMVWVHVRDAKPGYLLLAFALVVLPYWMRAIRWQRLLMPLGRPSFRSILRTTVIGFAALAVLPARAGDVLRPYLLARREGLSVTATFATIIMERILDLVAVLVLLSLFLWGFADSSSIRPDLLQPIKLSALVTSAVAVGLFGLTWLLATHPERVGSLVRTAGRALPHRLAERLASSASSFSTGFAAVRDPRGLLLALFWSFPVWLSFAAETWAVTRAFGIEMSLPGAFLIQAMLVIGVAVPTPGGVGSYHEMYRLGVTTFFGAPNAAAVAAAIVLHAISFIPAVVVGLVFMAQDSLSLTRLRDLAGAAEGRGVSGV